MAQYYDMRSSEAKSVEGVFTQVFGEACRSLHLRLNEGYDMEQEQYSDIMREEISHEQLFRAKKAKENEQSFEDDVIAYLMVRAREWGECSCITQRIACHDSEISARVQQAKHPRVKADIYATHGDFLFFSMASNVLAASKERKQRSASYYHYAHGLEERARGFDSPRAAVFGKLAVRFQRYFALAAEAFQDAFYQAHLKPEQLHVSKASAIDELLEALHAAKDAHERDTILKRLKDIAAEK